MTGRMPIPQQLACTLVLDWKPRLRGPSVTWVTSRPITTAIVGNGLLAMRCEVASKLFGKMLLLLRVSGVWLSGWSQVRCMG
mgnify:CR=1 FL=1